MKLIVKKDFDEVSSYVADEIIAIINKKSDATLGLATGGTPERVYDFLVQKYEKKQIDFSNVSTINLDEYVGLEKEHPQSYAYYMHDRLFNKVNIKPDNVYVPSGINESESIIEFNERLDNSTIDLQLLGVGANGHIGFNEPSDMLYSRAHIAELEESTVLANSIYFESKLEVPTKAITMGMSNILKSRKIILLAKGDAKKHALKRLLLDDFVTTKSPCTFLKLHSDVTVVIEEDMARQIGV